MYRFIPAYATLSPAPAPVREFWVSFGFALLPLAALVLATAIEARGVPTPAAFAETLELAGAALAATPSP